MPRVIDKSRATIIKRGRVALGELELTSQTQADRTRLDRVLRAMWALDDEQTEAYSVIDTAVEQIHAANCNDALLLLSEASEEHANQVANGGEQKPICAMGRYCSDHGFIHGSEAEELRKRLERLICDNERVSDVRLQHLLDDVDARDSLAFLEGKEKRAKKVVKRGQ